MKIILLGVAVLFWLAVSSAQEPAKPAAKDEKLDPAIPKTDPKKYESVRGEDWANPCLVIRAYDVVVISRNKYKRCEAIPVKHLAKTLAALPVKAWPYGKVVAALETGIRSGGDDKPIKENKEAVTSILKKLDVKVKWYPSA